MIRLKRYLVALTSLVVVLLVGHFYVNKAITISTLTPAEIHQNLDIVEDNRLQRTLTKWTQSNLSNTFHQSSFNTISTSQVITSTHKVINERVKTFTISQNHSNSLSKGVIEPIKKKVPSISGHIPIGVDVRPYMVDPVKYAIRMAKIRLLIELYGPHVVREARQKSNGDLLLPSVGIPRKQVLVVSYWRSGSSFLGDLLDHYPATFYHFEPLHSLTINRVISTETEQAEALRLLSHLLRCEFEDLEKYLLWIRQKNNQFLFTHNHRLWTACRIRMTMCFEPHFLSSICSEHPVQLLKVVRLPLIATKTLLQENPQLKVVYLLRDPRGMFSSRLSLDWCNTSVDCIRPDIACTGIRRDLVAAKELKAEFPTRFLAMRYEDLAFQPEMQTEALFKFLEFELTRQIQTFLQANTKARGKNENWNPYSTRRDSKSTALKWRHKLSFEQVQKIQNACGDIIRETGFDLINSEEEQKNNISLVT